MQRRLANPLPHRAATRSGHCRRLPTKPESPPPQPRPAQTATRPGQAVAQPPSTPRPSLPHAEITVLRLGSLDDRMRIKVLGVHDDQAIGFFKFIELVTTHDQWYDERWMRLKTRLFNIFNFSILTLLISLLPFDNIICK
jgi:hypothetical protein